jgi:glycosyltransferase involved in cell wall biosynthesis
VLKLAIQQLVFPVYRVNLLAELALRAETLVLIHDPDSPTKLKRIQNLPGVSLKDNIVERHTRHIWFRGFLIEWNLLGTVLSERPDALILQGSIQYLTSWLTMIVCRMRRIRVYLWTHGALGSENRLKITLRRAMMKLADGVMLYGQHAREILVTNGVPPAKLHVIYNSLGAPPSWESLRVSLEPDLVLRAKLFPHAVGLPIVVFIGRLQQEKRLDLVLHCLQRSLLMGKPFNFLCVGGGPELASLRNLVNHHEIADHVKFYGETYDEGEIRQLLLQAEVCVSPGSVGLTAIHALGCGVPVITHDSFNTQGPEFEAIIPGTTGDFYRMGDLGALLDAIMKWTNRGPNRMQTAEACWRVVAENYSPDVQAERMMRVMQNGRFIPRR